MPQYIADTAQLMCDKGSSPAQLKVTSQQFVKIEGKLMATEKDETANINIPPLGVCSITQKKCMPQPKGWQKSSEFDSINDNKKLTDQSFCPCAIGGKINFAQPGQTGFVTIK